MARPQKPPPTSVTVPAFVNDELGVLVNVLTSRAKTQVARGKVIGALVLAAQQLPPEVVEALFPAYEDRETTELPRSTGVEDD